MGRKPRPRAPPSVPARRSGCWRGAARLGTSAYERGRTGAAAGGSRAIPKAGLAAERAGLPRASGRPPHSMGSAHLLNKGLALGKAARARALPAAGGAGRGAALCARARVRAGGRSGCACAGCARVGGGAVAARARYVPVSAPAPPSRPPVRPPVPARGPVGPAGDTKGRRAGRRGLSAGHELLELLGPRPSRAWRSVA